ncbi:MAG TPA: hypothetical protein VLT33_00955 [Labilithrix sp.]|nr:hypothetical protein [Labilithrix sp.]
MTKTAAALLLLLTLGATACTAEAGDLAPPGARPEKAVVTTVAPAEMVGTWESSTVQGSVSSWTFEADGVVLHTVAVVSGPSACRQTTTTAYEGAMQLEGRTLTYTATRATETNADCKGTVTTPGKRYAETLTYELTSAQELVLREVSKCQQSDRASRDAFCRTTYARQS